jgi:zinc/manganese transport system substrate-binding protein
MNRLSIAVAQMLLARPLALIACLALSACAPPAPAPPVAKRLQVVTTFLPITLFTRAVAGDCADVKALIPANAEPHDFQATPADLAALKQAQLLVKNGLGVESFLTKLVTAAANPGLVVIDSSQGVKTLESPEAAHQGHSQRHSHGEVNPHIWLDPLRAVQQVENIRAGLIKADPSCAAGYRNRAGVYISKLQQLNSENSGKLKPYSGKTFVVFHDFAPYFADRYKLKADYLVDVPEINPSPADLQRVSAEVKRSQLKALLSEPQQGERSFNALAKDLGVKIVVFDPIETASAQAAQNPDTYFKLMRSNVADLLTAFGS